MRPMTKKALLMATAVLVATATGWAVTPYSQDFEALGLAGVDDTALANDGWLVYKNIFDDLGGYQGGGAVSPTPNGSICAVVEGQGGVDQGSRQLSVYSDYADGNHGTPDWVVETNVYQQQTIEADDVGQTVVFSFDAKLGNLELASEAEAFIKTLNPAAGWATTNHVTTDMTSIPTTWGSYTVEFTIGDVGLVGQVLQFGFTTRASNYQGSGVYYDNINQPLPVNLMSLSVE